jgi:hypothetical protein
MGLSTPFLIAGVALADSDVVLLSDGLFFIADGRTCGVTTGGLTSVILERDREDSVNGGAAKGFGFLPEDPPLRLGGRPGTSKVLVSTFERLGPSSRCIRTEVEYTFFL